MFAPSSSRYFFWDFSQTRCRQVSRRLSRLPFMLFSAVFTVSFPAPSRCRADLSDFPCAFLGTLLGNLVNTLLETFLGILNFSRRLSLRLSGDPFLLLCLRVPLLLPLQRFSVVPMFRRFRTNYAERSVPSAK